MSYKYDPFTDTFTHIPDEGSITVPYSPPHSYITKEVEISDECIKKIADEVVKKLRGEYDGK